MVTSVQRVLQPRRAAAALALILGMVALIGPGPVLAQYEGAEYCSNCHEEQYEQWSTMGHRFILTEAQEARHRQLPLPSGTSWDDFSYVVGGNKTKALFLDNDGRIYTPAGGDNQYNLLTGEWSDYYKGETRSYDCGECHTTGYEAGGNPAGLPGISGTFDLPGVQCEHCHGPGMAMEVPDADICADCHSHGDLGTIKASGGFIVSEGQYNEFSAGPHAGLPEGCVTCHNPHQKAEFGIKVECGSCHAEEASAFAGTVMAKAGLQCPDCHMPPATLSAQALGPHKGDMRTHIFYVNTNPAANMFTSSGANVALTDGKAAVTLDFVCQRCHQGASVEELAKFAKDFHDAGKPGNLDGFGLDPGLSGTWWNQARDGEGFVLEFAYAGADLYLFASMYTYDTEGKQTWLVAASPLEAGEDSATVAMLMPVDGKWGDAHVPAEVDRMPWGTGTFTFPTCSSGTVSLEPNTDMQALGFTALSYDIYRILAPGIKCPTFANNTE